MLKCYTLFKHVEHHIQEVDNAKYWKMAIFANIWFENIFSINFDQYLKKIFLPKFGKLFYSGKIGKS